MHMPDSILTSAPDLYKFMTAEGAKEVLRRCEIRCSSPILFNDPFDCQLEARWSFSDDELDERFAKKILDLVSYGTPLPVSSPEIYRPLYEQFQSELREGKPPDKILNDWASVRRLVSALPETKTHNRGRWWESFQRDFRVSAFSETFESIIMWSHYANHHKGVCLKFAASSSIAQRAMKVDYKDDLPRSIASVDDWCDLLLGLGELDWNHLIEDYLLRKNPEWSYELEWRILVPRSKPDDLHTYIPFDPMELNAIIFGVRISEIDRFAIKSLCAGKSSNFRFRQARRSKSSFRLDFSDSGD